MNGSRFLWGTTLRGALLGVLLCAPLTGCGGPDAELIAQFQAAQAAFDRAREPGDFLKAASLYQQLLDRGAVSGGVLYNQGNAFLRAGETGRAIAAYRQAQRYRPRDPFLAANLRSAQAASPTAAQPPLIERVLVWQNALSYPTKFHLTATAALLAFTFGLIALRAKHAQPWRRAAQASLALTILCAASAAYDWHRFERVEHGAITTQVIARKGNSATYEPAFTAPLEDGVEFTLLERRGAWLLVRLAPDQDAWVPQSATVVY